MLKSLFGFISSENSVHEAAYHGDIKQMEKYIPLLKSGEMDIYALDQDYMTPLDCAFCGRRYPIAIQLLEIGADPHKRSTNGKTNIHEALGRLSVSAIRLMLWYGPDYEQIKDHHGKETAVEYIQRIDKTFPGFKKLIEDTANDAKRVVCLDQEGKQLVNIGDYMGAALKYQEIVSIFYKHKALEETLFNKLSKLKEQVGEDKYDITLRYNRKDEPYRDVLVGFYQSKVLKYTEKLCECYLLCDQSYQKLSLLSTEEKKQHLSVIKHLADLYTNLKQPELATRYAARAAQLIVESEPSSPARALTKLLQNDTPVANQENSIDIETVPLLLQARGNHSKGIVEYPFSNDNLRRRMISSIKTGIEDDEQPSIFEKVLYL